MTSSNRAATRQNAPGAYTMFAVRARYRALKKSGSAEESFRAWARKTYKSVLVTGKLAEIAGKGDRDERKRHQK